MIELYQFAPAWGLNVSPFCLKVEIYCRLAGIAYEAKSALPSEGPRGKLPFIVDRSTCVPDSGKIINYLKATYGDPLDGELSEGELASAHMLRRLCEESLYFVILYSRWLDDDAWPKLKEAFFGALPPVARDLVPSLVRRGIRKSLSGQGYGRHPQSEVYAAGAEDLRAIAWQLGQHTCAGGDAVSSFDATMYAFLFNIVRVPLDTPLKTEAAKHPAIAAYLERMDEVLASRGVRDAA